jgi:uncharacterized membrane protein
MDFEPQRDLENERQEQRTALLIFVIAGLMLAIVVLVAVQRFVLSEYPQLAWQIRS